LHFAAWKAVLLYSEKRQRSLKDSKQNGSLVFLLQPLCQWIMNYVNNEFCLTEDEADLFSNNHKWAKEVIFIIFYLNGKYDTSIIILNI